MSKFEQYLLEESVKAEPSEHLYESMVAFDQTNPAARKFLGELGIDIQSAKPGDVLLALAKYFVKNPIASDKIPFLKSKGFTKFDINDDRALENAILKLKAPRGQGGDEFGKIYKH